MPCKSGKLITIDLLRSVMISSFSDLNKCRLVLLFVFVSFLYELSIALKMLDIEQMRKPGSNPHIVLMFSREP